ncbi:MAG TPA: trypsin [Nitrospiraceae bacterium]|nr:trypsin [Nitrospiraceae bacterium]
MKVEAASLKSVFKRAKPSVVVLMTEETIQLSDREEVSAPGLGSGVLISKDGKILTAAHVVQTADDIVAVFHNGKSAPAKVIASEPVADIALLQLTKGVPKGTAVAKVGDSNKVATGDEIFIIGAPYGLSYTLTAGHISARHKPNTMTGTFSLAEFFQTDAAVNEGNSGGPMFNMRGEVVGIVSHIITKSGGFEGLGFIVSSNTAKELLLDRKSFWGGMAGYLLDGTLAGIFNLPQKRGVLVQQVAKGSPSALIGLKGGIIEAQIGNDQFLVGGDIILGVNGISFAARDVYLKIKRRLNDLPKGSKITITVLRAGVKKKLMTTK